MNRLTLDILLNCFGEPESQSGDEYIWQCPLCKDTGRDNLKFNTAKGILWCFADESHAPQLLREILKRNKNKICFKPFNNDYENTDRYKKFFTIQKQMEFRTYMKECNEALQKSLMRIRFLHQKRGLNTVTVKAVKIGIDEYKKRWVIPTFQYSTQKSNIILGFEYRPLNLGKDGLRREKGAPKGLAMINSYKSTTEALVIVEGYFDGYALLQYLHETRQLKYYHIVTPPNGVQSLLKYISQVDFAKYKKFFLYLDNDEEGNKVAAKIIERYPMFQRILTPCGCKDFNEHYLKCIKAQS